MSESRGTHFWTLVESSIEADVQRVMSERGTGKGSRGLHVQCFVCFKRVRKLRLHIRKSHRELCPLSCSDCPAKFVGRNDLNNHQRNGCPCRKNISSTYLTYLTYRVTSTPAAPGSLIGKRKAI